MSEAMGAQPTAELLALLRQCEATDGGVMVERRTGELGLDTLDSRLNLATSLTLDYDSGHIDDLAPTDDDLLTVNDVTVTRSGGSSGHAEQTTGPMGTDPITGAGRYERPATLSLHEDDQARHQAGWRVWLGTVNEYRYPQLQVKLHNPRLSALVDDIAAVDISNRVTITNLPSTQPPDDVELMVEGYTEVINSFEWTIAFNCAPYSPYRVGTIAEDSGDTSDFLGWLDWDSCELVTAVDADDTTFLVTAVPTDSTTADDFPRDSYIGGELVTVTASTTGTIDNFSRSTSNGWGNAFSGQAWTVLEGSTAGFSTDGTVGIHSHSTLANRSIYQDLNSADQDVTVHFRIPVAITGGSAAAIVDLRCRLTSGTNYHYRARASVSAAGVMTFTLGGTGSAGGFSLGTGTSLTYNAAQTYGLRLSAIGSVIKAKFWNESTTVEPDYWHLVATDTTVTTGDLAACFSIPSNATNVLPFEFWFDNFNVHTSRSWTVTRNVNGITGGKSHSAGAEITLAQPFVLAL